MASSKRAGKSAQNTRKTAPRGEQEAPARARSAQTAEASSRDTAGIEPGRGTATGRNVSTDSQPEGLHAAHPDQPGNPEVRHAEPAQGKQSGEGAGGYPSGEYDVTAPTPAPASTKSQIATIMEAHFDGQDSAQLAKDAEKNARLDPKTRVAALEAMPNGILIEKQGPNRWRAHVGGQNRYGHGATFTEAVESYILGTSATTAEDEAAQRFLQLPASQQKEIEERDQKAAARLGSSVDNFAREEAKKTAAADKTAALPAPNASTDGPEKASARGEQGMKQANQPSPSSKRANAAKRTSSKKK